jgi:outer membrane receptor protein involved in Fe transport
MVRAALGHAVLCACVAVASPVLLGAQSSCLAEPRVPISWRPPLDRLVTLSDQQLPLRDGLERVAAAASIRLAYSSELLPATRQVCARFAQRQVGDVLVEWLGGTGLAPVAVAADRVVLTPSRAPSAEAAPPTTLQPAELAAVVVTGSVDAEEERSTTYAKDVITHAELREMGATTLQQALSAATPGFWMWTPMPNGLPSSFGSARGASSFGMSYPKVYIDGIEVANPLLLSTFGPDDIDRIEVIRGPQGAAMYGSDAISGVINITTRRDAPPFGGTRVELRSSAGLSQTDYAPLGAFAQAHAVNVRGGSATRSGSIGLATTRLGAWIPGAYSHQFLASGGANWMGARDRFQLTGRYFTQQASGMASSLLSFIERGVDSVASSAGVVASPGATPAGPEPQSVSQYTLGANLARQGERWLYAFVLGLDGYRLQHMPLQGQIRTASDSALLAASGGADRLTMRVSGTAQFGDGTGPRSSLTLGADQSVLRDATSGLSAWPLPGGAAEDFAWRNSGGVMAHGDVTLGGAFVVSGGVRLERHAGYTALSEVATLPTVGVAYTREVGPATVTLRSAYGKAIRPPRLSRIASDWSTQLPSVLRLEPEEQSGVETGADVLFGSALRLRVTHFDQRATGLIQPVAVVGYVGTIVPRRVTSYELQNVGAIDNRGWEFQAGLTQGRLHLSGTYSMLASLVDRVADTYTGDLRAGDRVLQVPARTLSLTSSWTDRSWSASWTLARASDWTNYDWLAVAGRPAGSAMLAGSELRPYWRNYDGVTRLRAHVTRDITDQFGFVFTGENLLGQQLGEPDNVTIVPGRTISAGLRARF